MRKLPVETLTQLIFAKNAADAAAQKFQSLTNDAIRLVGFVAGTGAVCLVCGTVWQRARIDKSTDCPECAADA